MAEIPFTLKNFNSTMDIGVDEAGRGPLIGDMIISGVVATPDMLEGLISKGLRDSKKLGRKKRKFLYREAVKSGVIAVSVFVHPWRLDRENLNHIERESIKWILRVASSILESLKCDKVDIYIDEVRGIDKDMRTFVDSLYKRFSVKFIMEASADSKYPAVALASIFAKVIRDNSIELLKRHVGDFGSGYMSDRKLKTWISMTYNSTAQPPVYLRRTWRPLKMVAPSWYINKRRRVRHRNLLDYVKW